MSSIPAAYHATKSTTIVTQTVEIGTPGTFVSQQGSALDVTLNLITTSRTTTVYETHVYGLPSPTSRTTSSNIPNPAPLTVNFSATLGSLGASDQEIPLPASASDTFTPIDESITFPPGVTSLNVTIPINSGAANPGEVPIVLSVTPPSSSIPLLPQQSTVYLVDGPQGLPPSITSARLVFTRRHASGIAITFSEPMAPATVENLHNYSIVTGHEAAGVPEPVAIPLDVLSALVPITPPSAGGPILDSRPIAIKAARYDAATDTVILIPTKPLVPSRDYFVASPKRLAGHAITNLEGEPLYATGMNAGSFSIAVHQRPSTTQPPTVSSAS